MLTGILCGFGAALMQSVSYVYSARFISQFRVGAVSLLVLTHVVLGIVSLLALPLVWHDSILEIDTYLLPLLAMALSYLVGQFSLFQAIRYSEASRVSPLLGLKILMLALIGSLWFGEAYAGVQWMAVLLCVLGAVWLSASGGRVSRGAIGWVLGACTGYALSDLSVLYIMRTFDHLSLTHAAAIGVCLCYLLCGIGSLFFLPRVEGRHLLVQSAPAALTWLAAMIFLFACFAEIGVLFGGIVQSSRGLISIFLGIFLTYVGFRFAEKMPARGVFLQRLGASVLMLVAIVVFSLGGEGGAI